MRFSIFQIIVFFESITFLLKKKLDVSLIKVEIAVKFAGFPTGIENMRGLFKI